MSASSSNPTFTPQSTEEKKSIVAQEFQSVEKAFTFYNAYARECGFSARMSNSKMKKGTNELIWKQFVCSKEGQTDDTYQRKLKASAPRTCERNRATVRLGCKAKLTLVKRQTGPNWIVSSLVEKHNHTLATPTKVHLLRSHRNVSIANRALNQQLSAANIPTCQQIRVMEIEYGDPENVGCTEKDLRNYETKVEKEQREFDAESLIEFFSSETEKNQSFFFDFELDEENRLVKCFWADPIARKSYDIFGDVVFDTTYNRNKYGMIFAPLTGVNYHGQTIIFGCGFLSDEKTESFIWLFNKLMDATSKCAPQVIITDQDPAIAKVIAQAFPSTVHRYYIWHILNKFSTKIDSLVYRDNYHRFRSVIFNSETSEEFEAGWMDLIHETKLQGNDWLGEIFEIHDKWIPAYVNMHFSAGMSSSQRAESSHSFFKKYISKRNSLMDFISRFNGALSHQRNEELVADHVDVNEKPKLKSLWAMVAEVYTKRNFRIFQNEMFESTAYTINSTFEDDETILYRVHKPDENSSSRCRQVRFNKQTDVVSCSYRQFEFKRIPCRHMFAFFRFRQVIHLPSQYILMRWTRDAKTGVHDNYAEQMNDPHDMLLMTRHASLSHYNSIVIDDASLTGGGTNFLMNELKVIHGKIKEINGSMNAMLQSTSNSMKQTTSISNPLQVRSKGCGKKLKSRKVIAIAKLRLCRGCGLRRQAHDKRNCPMLNESTTIDGNSVDSRSSTDDELASQAESNVFGSAKRL